MDHTGHAMPPEGIETYAAAVPHLLGYHPDQALVVIPLTRTPRPLPALALPLNPPPGAEQLARRLRPLAPAYARQEVLLYTFSDRPESGLSDERCNWHWGFVPYRFSAAGIRVSNVTAKAFRAGFHLVTHRAWPRPLGSSERVTR